MRYNPNRIFPYPACKPVDNDYKTGIFHVEYTIEEKMKYLEISYNVTLTSSYLSSNINDNNAVLVFHVENPNTKFREIFPSKTMAGSFSIDVNDINGSVEVIALIVSKKDFVLMNDIEFDDFFMGYSFRVYEGNILAIDYEMIIDVSKDITDEVDIPSIINFSRSDEQNEMIKYDFSRERLTIFMNNDTYIDYHEIKRHGNKLSLINSVMVIPLLNQAIQIIKDDKSDDFNDLKWFRSLVYIFKERGIECSDISFIDRDNIELTQELVSKMLSNGLKYLKGISS